MCVLEIKQGVEDVCIPGNEGMPPRPPPSLSQPPIPTLTANHNGIRSRGNTEGEGRVVSVIYGETLKGRVEWCL